VSAMLQQSQLKHSTYDVVIVGGGMVGASLACALQEAISQGLKVLVVERFPLPEEDDAASPLESYQPSYDARSTALSFGSRSIFEAIGIWPVLSQRAEAIQNIHVSDRGHFGAVRMNATEENVEALGYVVENQWLGRVLLNQIKQQNKVDWLCPASVVKAQPASAGVVVELDVDGQRLMIDSQLMVLADGGRSSLREDLGLQSDVTPYGQQAIIANVSVEKAHQGTAYERFTDQGPMALLPLRERTVALVWTLPEKKAQKMLANSDQEFLEALQQAFGFRLGELERVGQRVSYPLALIRSKEQHRSGMVVLGNAAHTLHPVAGQGFNLALRGVATLAEKISAAYSNGEPVGALTLLREFSESLSNDQEKTIQFSHQIVKAFSNNHPLLSMMRDFGLVTLDCFPTARSALTRYAMGLGERLARLG